jgi:hypothetical protein
MIEPLPLLLDLGDGEIERLATLPVELGVLDIRCGHGILVCNKVTAFGYKSFNYSTR